MSNRQEINNIERFKSLTQTGAELELMRLNNQINNFKQRIADLSGERCTLYKAARTLGIELK